jgi:hypothetical protein
MDSTSDYSPEMMQLESDFRALRKSTIEAEEHAMKNRRRELVEYEKEKAKLHEEFHQVLKKGGVDIEKIVAGINRIDDKAEKVRKKYVSEARLKFTEQDHDPDVLHRENIIRNHYYSQMGGRQPTCLGADLLVSDAKMLKNVKRASGKGNPGVWFNNPADLRNVKVSQTGSMADDPYGQVVFGNVATAIWWYYFQPEDEGDYWFLVVLPYHGFYTVNSDDRPCISRYAEVDSYAKLNVHQHFWHGERKQDIYRRFVRDATEIDYVPGDRATFDFHDYLYAADTVIIKLSFTILAEAKGKGSFAEMDFDTGAANWVGQPQIIVG